MRVRRSTVSRAMVVVLATTLVGCASGERPRLADADAPPVQSPTAAAAATTDPSTTQAATTTEEPTTTDAATTTEEPTTTDAATTTEEPTTTDAATTTEEPTTTDAATTTEEPTTTDAATTTEEPTTTEAATTTESSTTTTSSTTSTTVADTTTTSSTTSTTVADTTTTAATTTTVPAPVCVVTIEPGDSLSAIAQRLGDPNVTVEALQRENRIGNPNSINAGDPLDVCIDNGVDDRTGQTRELPPPGSTGVMAQQQQLNALLTPLGFPEMAVDGDAGAVTRRGLCAARVAFGLPISRDEMAPDSDEERWMMAFDVLPTPANAPGTNRWVLIDQTCQVMFAGSGSSLTYVFPVSTGQPRYPTRDQRGSRVFRYNPASHNGGWHNSSDYPAAADNPLNGNMYKPLYFDRGQAIHGANTVPTSPQSHGCVRVKPWDMDTLVSWVGLGGVDSPINSSDRIGLVVTIQGRY